MVYLENSGCYRILGFKTLPPNMTTWSTGYFNLKELEKCPVLDELGLPLRQIIIGALPIPERKKGVSFSLKAIGHRGESE